MKIGASETTEAAARALLAWFESGKRDLPWRRRRDPYSIWVSEIMLQQTRVDTVLGYYETFLGRFPDVEALAAADEEDVLAAWSGLGYYRRARYLHAAARQVAADGEWPVTAEQWRQLPGIGEYTAAAISSIVGGEEVAVLDGNVERVTARLLAHAGDPKRAADRRILGRAAGELLVPGRAGDSNQALMELGATVCLPHEPLCERCPLCEWCVARAEGHPERYPQPRRRRRTEAVARRVFVVKEGTRFLLFRRAADAPRLAGFWELPWVEGPELETPNPETADVETAEPEGIGAAAALRRKYGGTWTIGASCGKVRHSITHRRFTIDVRGAGWRPDGASEATAASWYSGAEIENLATSSLVGKALASWRARFSG